MRVTSNCDPINTVIINQSTGIQFVPDIAFGGGNYMVVWTDGRGGGNAYRTYAARVTPAGTVLDPAGIQVGPSDSCYQYSPSVVYNGTNFFAVWGYYYSPYRILGRFINTNGTLSDTFRIATMTYNSYKVRVAYSGSNYLVAWVAYGGSSYDLQGQIVSTGGMPVGGPFTIATNVYYYSLGLCFDGTQYCVTYNAGSPYQTWGRKYAVNGSPLGSAFLISSSSNYEYYCAVAPGANNRYLNVWSEYISSSYDIRGNVDVLMVGINEAGDDPAVKKELTTTIVSGPLIVPKGKTVRIFDISGRQWKAADMVPGIYFTENDGVVTGKIVKVK